MSEQTAMPPAVDQALAGLIQQTASTMQDGAMFVQSQLPDVLQQVLAYQLIYSLLWAGLCAGLLAFLAYNGLRRFPLLYKIAKESRYDSKEEYAAVPTIFFSGFSYLGLVPVCAIGFCENAMTAVQIAVAPKMFLIEYAASLVK